MIDRPSYRLSLVDASFDRAQRDAIDVVALTVAQQTFVQDPSKVVLWRDGNQLGKSFALAYWVIAFILGRLPIRRRGPIRVLVVSYSLEQMVPLMEKLWALAPKHVPGEVWMRGGRPRLEPECGFDPGRGITGKPPRLIFTDGSEIVFATYKQGAARIAGGTFDAAVMDEPPSEGVYGEIVPRLFHKKGYLRVTMTPVPDMPDCKWLWDKADDPEDPLREYNFGLTESILIPAGYPVPWSTQEEIDEYAAGLLPVERAMRIEGARDPIVTGRWLKNFSDDNIVDVQLSELRGWYLVVGVDHGAADGKQAAMLIAVKDRHTNRPQVVWLDEAWQEGLTLPEHDAQLMLAMLKRNGLSYDDVDAWVGDIPTGSQRYEIRKSNKDLRQELALQLRRPLRKTKEFAGPRKGRGSRTKGARLLNTLFGRSHADGTPHARVRPRCEMFIRFCREWDGDEKHETKDVGDAGRYPTEHACKGRINFTFGGS